MKIQGPWGGAEGVVHIFTAWLTSTSTTNERIPVFCLPLFVGKCNNVVGGRAELDFTVIKAGHEYICM